MPSNFHVYAVDKDGDGRADIWTSLPDVFASMGNFISTYCEWDPKVNPRQPYHQPALQLPTQFWRGRQLGMARGAVWSRSLSNRPSPLTIS